MIRVEDRLTTNLLFGAFAFLFGLLTLTMRFVVPHSALFSKVAPLKERFGDKAGVAIHVLAYSVMPLVVGVTLLASELLAP